MATYYFHLHERGEVLVDQEGREIVSAGELAAIALREARAIIAHEALAGRVALSQVLVVEDAAHVPVHRLRFIDAVEIVRT